MTQQVADAALDGPEPLKVDMNKDSGDSFQYDPNFTGVDVTNRKCTDCVMTVFFILFICGMLALFFAALPKSNYKYLYIPTDHRGQMCGYDNSKIKFASDPSYPFNSTGNFLDLTTKPHLFWVRPGKKGYSRSFCVEKCPEAGLFLDTFEQMVLNYNGLAENTLCGSNPNSTKATLQNYSDPTAYYCPYASKLFALRCLPTTNALASSTKEQIATMASNISESLSAVSAVANAIQDLYLTWPWIALGCAIALVLSLLWLVLLRFLAGCIVWLTVLLSLAGLGILTYMCWRQRTNSFGNTSKMEAYTLGLYNEKLNKNIFTAMFAILVVVDVIFVLLVIFLFSRVKLSIGIIKVVARVFGKLPQLFFFPILVYVLLFIWWAYIIGVAVVLFGAGNPYHVYDSEYLVDKIQYKYDVLIQGFSIYHFIGFLWGTWFLIALGDMTIAGVFAEYYFAKEPKKENLGKWTLMRSFGRCWRYHVGSLAIGSLIITIMSLIRMIVEFIDKKTKEKQNACVSCCIKCMKCCFNCLDKFLKFLNKNTYIMIAMHGYNFWSGCKQAFSLLLRNVVRVSTLNYVADFTLLLGRIFVCGSVTSLAMYLFTKLVEGVTFVIIPSLIVFIISFLASGAFTSVFDMGIDSMMLCFLEDEERNDGSPGHEKHTPDELKEFLQN